MRIIGIDLSAGALTRRSRSATSSTSPEGRGKTTQVELSRGERRIRSATSTRNCYCGCAGESHRIRIFGCDALGGYQAGPFQDIGGVQAWWFAP